MPRIIRMFPLFGIILLAVVNVVDPTAFKTSLLVLYLIICELERQINEQW